MALKKKLLGPSDTLLDMDLLHLRDPVYVRRGNLEYLLLRSESDVVGKICFALSREELCVAMLGVLSALGYLHSLLIVHGNVSIDAIRYDCRREVFVLSDLYSLCHHTRLETSRCAL